MSIENTYKKIKKLTSIDVELFFKDYISFVNDGDYQKIYNYYYGLIDSPQKAFTEKDKLLEQALIIENTFKKLKNNFQNLADWDVLLKVEDVITKLQTVNNLRKYIKSTSNNFSSSIGIRSNDYILKQRENLENVSSKILLSPNPQDDWVDVAITNDIKEEDYDKTGGNTISLVYNKKGTINNVDVVFDELIGERVKGKDIQKYIEFEDNDLKILGYQDTLLQSIDILLSLRTNDNPEFPNDGIKGLIGATASAFAYPILFRQLMKTFSTDDTIVAFKVTDISLEEDAAKFNIEIEAITGEIIENQSLLV